MASVSSAWPSPHRAGRGARPPTRLCSRCWGSTQQGQLQCCLLSAYRARHRAGVAWAVPGLQARVSPEDTVPALNRPIPSCPAAWPQSGCAGTASRHHDFRPAGGGLLRLGRRLTAQRGVPAPGLSLAPEVHGEWPGRSARTLRPPCPGGLCRVPRCLRSGSPESQ